MKPYRGHDIEGYLDSLDSPNLEIVQDLRSIIHEAIPDAKEEIKWGTLVFERGTIIGVIMSHRDTVNLQLWKGAELDDKEGLLQGSGKAMRHIAFTSRANIKRTKLKHILREAARLTRRHDAGP